MFSKGGGIYYIYAIMCCVARDGWERGIHVTVSPLLLLDLEKTRIFVIFFKKLNDSNTNDKIMVKVCLTLWL